jgi:parvulin-like peptidyl-prolyl isomerase
MRPVSRVHYCRLIAVLGLACFIGAGCRRSETALSSTPDAPVILIVNREPIHRTAWETFSALRLGDLKRESLSNAVQSQMLDDFILKRALLQEAARRGVVLAPAEVPSASAVAAPEDAKSGVSSAERERERTSDALIQKLQKTLAEKVAPPTREDVVRYYEERPAEFQRTGFYLREIRVDSKTVIEELARRLAGGDAFAELARKHSRGPNAAQGGLSYYERGQLPLELEAKVLALRPGEISPAVKTGYGFHIFKLERLAKPLSFESVREEILDDIIRQRRRDIVVAETKRILSAAQVELFPAELGFEYVGSFRRSEK